MPRLPAALLIALAATAAGCEVAPDPSVALPALDGAGGSVEWRGTLPCADCDGIDTQLVLQRGIDGGDGGVDHYTLVEVYLARDGSMRFEETGRWRVDRAMLSLEPGTGGLRRFALMHDGGLQARDATGLAFPGREGDILQPASARP